jgi:hypothetical protein
MFHNLEGPGQDRGIALNWKSRDILCIKRSKRLEQLRQKKVRYPLAAVTETTIGDYYAVEKISFLYTPEFFDLGF